jgi:hypothetical protein
MNIVNSYHLSTTKVGLSKDDVVAGPRGLFVVPCPIACGTECPLDAPLERLVGLYPTSTVTAQDAGLD